MYQSEKYQGICFHVKDFTLMGHPESFIIQNFSAWLKEKDSNAFISRYKFAVRKIVLKVDLQNDIDYLTVVVVLAKSSK